MKRKGNLFERLTGDENLNLAIDEVNQTHRWHPHHKPNKVVAWVDGTKAERVKELREIILQGFDPSPSTPKRRWDKSAGKWRDIYEPRLWPDQYIHHALVQVLQPVMMRGMDGWCCGSIRGRGIHYGMRGIKKWMRNDPKGTRWCAELDIHHFYESLQPAVVMERMRRLVKDRRVLDLIERVTRHGIQIGAYYSQWLANTVLQPMDHALRESGVKITHYIRYMDNITLYARSKRALDKAIRLVREWLEGHGMRLKDNWQKFRTADRLPCALGYRYGKRLHPPAQAEPVSPGAATADVLPEGTAGPADPDLTGDGAAVQTGATAPLQQRPDLPAPGEGQDAEGAEMRGAGLHEEGEITMEYIYGTTERGGVMVENLKTVGEAHTALSGFVGTVRVYGDGTTIEDRCRILEHYESKEQDGVYYDWYTIDSHYRMCSNAEGLRKVEQQVAAEAAVTAQTRAATRLYVQKATDITDEQALTMADLFLTWEEALAAGQALEANTVLNDDGQLYRVVQQVTPQAHQAPHDEGMLAIYRPIDQTHAGTLEDPIPFVYGMDTEEGKYYAYEGTTYLCRQTMTPCVWAPGTPGLWQWEVAA